MFWEEATSFTGLSFQAPRGDFPGAEIRREGLREATWVCSLKMAPFSHQPGRRCEQDGIFTRWRDSDEPNAGAVKRPGERHQGGGRLQRR